MRILQVIPSLDSKWGGTVEGLIQQCSELMAAGQSVDVLTLDSSPVPFDSRLRCENVFFIGKSYLNYRFSPNLEKWLRQHGPKYDLLIANGLWQYHGRAIYNISRRLGLKYVVFPHGMLDPYFKERYPLKHAKKLLYWWASQKSELEGARLVLFTTSEEMRLAQHSFPKYRVNEYLVGYGINRRDEKYNNMADRFLSNHPHLRGKRNLLFLSRIDPKKGCDILIEAFSKVAKSEPSFHLIMAGPNQSSWADSLHQRVKELGISDKVTFTGMLEGELKWGAFDCAEAFVLPSHQENFGIVIAEALSSGLPVLTTNKVNIWKEIKDSEAGIIETDDQAGVIRLLESWISLSDEGRDAMRNNALPCFRNFFDIKLSTDRLLDALKLAASDKAFSSKKSENQL